jgi:hypothetical protein
VRLLLSLLVASLALPAALSGQSPAVPKVTVQVSIDRTAAWIGDRVHYTIEFLCEGDADLLAEDLAKEKLPLRGGEVLSVETEHEPSAAGSVRRWRYTITSYAVDAAEISIESFPVRYFSRRTIGSTTQTPPAGQVTVARRVLALRSTLPDGGRLPELREPAALRVQPGYLRYLRPAGLVLVAIAIVPVALMLLDAGGWIRRARATRPRRESRRGHATALEELTLLQPASHQDRVRALAQLDHLVRDHLRLTTGIPAHALTPAEIGDELKGRPERTDAHTVESLLARCERARYAPDPVPSDAWNESLSTAQALLRGRAQ